MKNITEAQWEAVVKDLRERGINLQEVSSQEIWAAMNRAKVAKSDLPRYKLTRGSVGHKLDQAAMRIDDPQGWADLQAERNRKRVATLEAHADKRVAGLKRWRESQKNATEQAKGRHRPVHWKVAEYDLIAAELHRKHKLLILSPDLAEVKPAMLFDAQKRVLPPDRQRLSFNAMHLVRADLAPAFDRLREKVRAEEQARKTAEQAKKAEPPAAALVPVAPPPAAPEPAPAPAAAVAPMASLDDIVKAMARNLATTFADAFVDAFRERATVGLAQALPQILPPSAGCATKKTAQPAVRKPVIAVVGALPDQIHYLEKACTDVEIVGVPKDVPNSQIKSRVHGADKVISMTKFISHPTDHAIKAAVDDRYVPIHGAASEIKRYINEVFLPQRMQPAASLHA